jgi:hypothetical protein
VPTRIGRVGEKGTTRPGCGDRIVHVEDFKLHEFVAVRVDYEEALVGMPQFAVAGKHNVLRIIIGHAKAVRMVRAITFHGEIHGMLFDGRVKTPSAGCVRRERPDGGVNAAERRTERLA